MCWSIGESTAEPPRPDPVGWYSEWCGPCVCQVAVSWAFVSMPLGGQQFLSHAQMLWPSEVGHLSPEGDIRTGLELCVLRAAPGSTGLCGRHMARLQLRVGMGRGGMDELPRSL